jgi:hypothetical protein
MKLRFRLADEDEEEKGGDLVPVEPGGPMDPQDKTRIALVVAIGGVVTQALWPLPVIFAVVFGSVGGLIGVAALLRLEPPEAAFAFLVLQGALDFFSPPDSGVGFLVRGGVVSLGALGLVVAARHWILRSLGEEEDEARP